MTFNVELKVMPRKGILNPESTATSQGLKALGYSQVSDLEMGKFMVFTIETTDKTEAAKQIEEICQRLLTNPIIEDYTYQIFQVEGE